MKKIFSFFKLSWLPNFSEKFPEGTPIDFGDGTSTNTYGYGFVRWARIVLYYFDTFTDRLVTKFRALPQKTRLIVIFAKVAFIVILFAGTIGFDLFGTLYLMWIVYGLSKDKTAVLQSASK
jgi:hypothetical protein